MNALEWVVAVSATVGIVLLLRWLPDPGPRLWAGWTSRGEEAGTPEEEFDTQPRTSERDEIDELALLIVTALDSDDMKAWEQECATRPRIRRYVAELEERAQ